MPASLPEREAPVLRSLRHMLLGIVLFSMAGTFFDLLLMDHHQDLWQMIPLALFILATLATVVHFIRGSAASTRAVQMAMGLLLLGGLTGLFLHFRSSATYWTELNPSMERGLLTKMVLKSKVPPTLAPMTLVQMGLIGLASTYRHPSLRKTPSSNNQGEGPRTA